MRVVKQGDPATVVFLMVLSSDHVNPATNVSPVVTISKNGTTGAASFNTASQVDLANAPGWYKIALTGSETAVIGDLILHAVAGSCDPSDRLLIVESATTGDLTALASATTGIAAKTVNLPATPAAVADIPTAVMVATAVWANATRTLSSFGTLASDAATAVWGAATRTLSAFGFSVTAATVSDKTGYSLAATQTCNITGNLSGSVSSVTGSVGSVTAPVTLTAAYDGAKTASPTVAQIDAALTLAHGTGSWQSGSGGGGGSTGSGITPVNHDTGGTDYLRYLAPDLAPVDGGGICAFLKSAYDSGNYATPLGSTETRSDGRWKAPLMLDAGVAYTLVFYKQGVLQATTASVTP